MARVLVTRHLPPGGLDPLTGHEIILRGQDEAFSAEDLLDAAERADAVVCVLSDRIGEEVMEAAANLKVVANVAVGFDNVDVAAATRAGIVVCNTPGVLDETTADLAFALVLAASRLMGTAERDLRAGRWLGWGVTQYLGQDVHGSTLGIVGYGRIGRAVARRAQGFGMRVLHNARHATGEDGFVADLDEMLAEADVVSLHVPLSEESRRLIDERRLALMKPTAVLVNTSRGSVVDEEALAMALEENRIFATGLDVYEREPEIHPRLLRAPRTVLLPHIGSASVTTRTTMARLAAEGARAVLAGERPSNVVNPEVWNGS